MAKGAQAKIQVMNKLMEVFDGAFLYNDGKEILVHIGVGTVYANGEGFKIEGKKQGDKVNAGDPIVTVDLKRLRDSYDLTTMVVVTNPNGKDIQFIETNEVKKGQSLLK